MATRPSTPKSPAKGGPAAKAKPGAATPALSVVGGEVGDEAATEKAGAGLRLKDLVDRVVAATGGKRKGVKELVEATLVQMGEALQRGDSLNLPGLGKVRVARPGAEGGGAMTLKLRLPTGGAGKAKTGDGPIADGADQD